MPSSGVTLIMNLSRQPIVIGLKCVLPLKIAAFTNGLRDSILSGKIGANDITLAHKRVLYIDWKLTMAGYTGTVVVFGFILLRLAELTGSKVSIQGLALSVFVGAILFVICGIHDSRAIQQCITRQANDA